jgi:hypothetical protein
VDLQSAIDHFRSRGTVTARRDDGTPLTEPELALVASATSADLRAVADLHRFERDRATERYEVGYRLDELLHQYETPEAKTIGEVRLLMPAPVQAEFDRLTEAVAPDGWLYLNGSDS